LDELEDGDCCEILGRALGFPVDAPEYPSEWIYDHVDRPCCTAFVPVGEPVPARCTHTEDMFGE
jgi:hypothetical protein